MIQALLLNLCVLVTLTYLISLTYRTWPEPKDGRLPALRLMLEALMPLALLMSPAMIVPGVFADLRVVPLALTTLRFGAKTGLLLAVPVLLYRTYLGGAGLMSGYISILGVILAASIVRRRIDVNNPNFSWQAHWQWIVLIFMPNGLFMAWITHKLQPIFIFYLPILVLDLTGFLIAHSMLLSRFRLLQLTSQLKEQAHQDILTGLANRRQFDTDLPTLNHGGALLLIDIDHFKLINDEYGHLVGDLVLERIGQTLTASLRATDQAYRYGGEEFAVILRNIEQNGTNHSLHLAERIRQQFEAISIPELNHKRITVSIGVVKVSETATSHDTLNRADAALYHAKQQGRNQVRLWTPEQPLS